MYRQAGMSARRPQQGFTSLEDMIDGGGAGRAGQEFEGGGIISDLANLLFTPYGSRQRAQQMATRAPDMGMSMTDQIRARARGPAPMPPVSGNPGASPSRSMPPQARPTSQVDAGMAARERRSRMPAGPVTSQVDAGMDARERRSRGLPPMMPGGARPAGPAAGMPAAIPGGARPAGPAAGMPGAPASALIGNVNPLPGPQPPNPMSGPGMVAQGGSVTPDQIANMSDQEFNDFFLQADISAMDDATTQALFDRKFGR